MYVDFGALHLEAASSSPKTWNANHLTEVKRDEQCTKKCNAISQTLHIIHWVAAGDMKEIPGKTAKSIRK